MLKQVEGTLYVNNPVSHLKSDIRVDINPKGTYARYQYRGYRSHRAPGRGRLEHGRLYGRRREKYDIYLTTPKGERSHPRLAQQPVRQHPSGAAAVPLEHGWPPQA